MPAADSFRLRHAGFTIMEVMVAALLIAISMASIMTINVKSIHTLRASREAAASSQVLQQRIEMIRDRTWTEVSSADALAALLTTPAQSEAELSDAHFSEALKVTVPLASPTGPVESARTFSVHRADGVASVDAPGDFSAEPTLLFEGTVVWHDPSGLHHRSLRTVVCRAGLTRSGVIGSVIGRPGSGVSGP